MANFCGKCGAAVSGSGSFCVQCGNPFTAPPARPAAILSYPPAAPPAAPRAAAPARGGGLFKWILIGVMVFACLLVAGVVGAGWWVKNRVQDKVAELKSRTGIDLPGALNSAANSRRSGESISACEVLTKEDAGRILAMALTRAEGGAGSDDDQHCRYYASPTALEKARKQTKTRFDDLRTGHSGGTTAESLAAVEALAKGFGAAANDGNAPILELTIYRGNGKLATTAMNASVALMGGKHESVPGPWDEAVFGPMNSTLTVRKGNNGLLLDLRQVPHGYDKGLELARAIAPHL